MLEPGSLAAKVAHCAAVVLGEHRRDLDGRCTRPGCDDPCAVADYADTCLAIAKRATDVRALLTAERELSGWITRHVNPDGLATPASGGPAIE